MHFYQKPVKQMLGDAIFETSTPRTPYSHATMDMILQHLLERINDIDLFDSEEVIFDEKSNLIIHPSAFNLRKRKRYKHREEKIRKERKISLVPISIKTQTLPQHWTAMIIDSIKQKAYTLNTYPGYGLGLYFAVKEIVPSYNIIALNPINDKTLDKVEDPNLSQNIVRQQGEDNDCGPIVADFLSKVGHSTAVSFDSTLNIADSAITSATTIRQSHSQILEGVGVSFSQGFRAG